MTAGKNPKNFKRKGQKKKIAHPFARKDWYDIKAPVIFENRTPCLMPVTKTTGQKIASDSLKGRVVDISLADLNNNHQDAYRRIKLVVEEVSGTKEAFTNFHGMDMTKDKLAALIRKWQTLIEARVDVKTADGYFIRIFTIAFTTRKARQVKATSYAKSSKIKQIRKKMMELLISETQKNTLANLFKIFIKNDIPNKIIKECGPIYPLQNVFVRKVKVLKKPKFDAAKIQELYSESAEKAHAAAAPKEEVKEEATNLIA